MKRYLVSILIPVTLVSYAAPAQAVKCHVTTTKISNSLSEKDLAALTRLHNLDPKKAEYPPDSYSSEDFVISRGLAQYFGMFKIFESPDSISPRYSLADDIMSLGKDGQVTEFGAGLSRAARELFLSYEEFMKANLVEHKMYLNGSYTQSNGQLLRASKQIWAWNGDFDFMFSQHLGSVTEEAYADLKAHKQFQSRFKTFLNRPQDEKPQYHAISLVQDPTPSPTSRLLIQAGSTVETLEPQSFKKSDLVISSFGDDSYTKKLAQVLGTALIIVKPQGRIYLFGNYSKPNDFEEVYMGYFPKNSVQYEDKIYDLAEFMNKFGKGFKFHVDQRVESQQSPHVIEITSTEISMPILTLSPEGYRFAKPPHRKFVWTGEYFNIQK